MTYKVMIADDEPIMRKAMQTLIDWNALECELMYVASTGQEVMQKLQQSVPDIVILDIQMPGVNGLEIAKYIWEEKLPTKVILLTAYADFSYAQTAIKYDVVDYIIKTGAFEGIENAIEKAKEQIQKESGKQSQGNLEILKENFFKSVFDGTLYEREELEEKALRIGMDLSGGWLAVALRFRLNEEKKRDYTYQSLYNFLRMVFEKQMIYGVTIKKDMILVLLSVENENYSDDVSKKCYQVIEMMDNFMKMDVYIGISNRGMDIQKLKNAFDEAEYAITEGFFFETSKINYYQGLTKERREYLNVTERYLKELQYLIRKGKEEEAHKVFNDAVECLAKKGCSVNTMFDFGIEVKNWCKKMMADFDKTMYDIMPHQRSLSNQIYQCKHISEFTDLMNMIIGNTAKYINAAISKKNVLVYEVEKYIEENYEKNITVSEISRNVGVSLSYLSRIYKEATGKTLIHFLNEKKIEKAKEYLEQGDMKIYEIAEALAFENTTYFSYFFKKHTGVSPKDYKEEKDKQ